MGRPTKRTPEVVEKIREGLEAGMPRSRAAARAGISYETLKEWCRKDPEFSAKLNAHEAEGEYLHARYLSSHTKNSEEVFISMDSAAVAASKFYLSTRKTDPWVTQQATEVRGTLTVAEAARQAAAQKDIKEAMDGEE